MLILISISMRAGVCSSVWYRNNDCIDSIREGIVFIIFAWRNEIMNNMPLLLLSFPQAYQAHELNDINAIKLVILFTRKWRHNQFFI